MILANEFAAVEVDLDLTGNGPRLRIADLSRGGRVAYLDPMCLEALVWAEASELAKLSDPDRILAGVDRARDRSEER
jgi:hypothetical protein